jgi:hypothetical protein
MDQLMVPNWSENMDVNPKDLQLNHMTLPGLPLRGDSLRDVPPDLRYFHNFGNLHTDLLSLADPNTDGPAQDVDISVSTQGQLDGSYFQHNEASGTCRSNTHAPSLANGCL